MSRDRRFGTAWLLFVFALAVHVADEATHDFLSVYNPTAQMIRERFGIPIPVFTFGTWIVSLGCAVILLICLSPFAFRGAKWLRIVSLPLAIVVGLCNATLHIASSIYYGRFMPGVCSSPVLLAAAIFLLDAAAGRHAHTKAVSA